TLKGSAPRSSAGMEVTSRSAPRPSPLTTSSIPAGVRLWLPWIKCTQRVRQGPRRRVVTQAADDSLMGGTGEEIDLEPGLDLAKVTTQISTVIVEPLVQVFLQGHVPRLIHATA